MKKGFRSKRLAMLLVLMLTLSLCFQGVGMTAFAQEESSDITPPAPVETGIAGNGADAPAEIQGTSEVVQLTSQSEPTEYAVTFSVKDGVGGTLTAETVTYIESTDESIDGSNTIENGATVTNGTTVRFTATPADKYRVKQWRNNGLPLDQSGNTYEFTVQGCEVNVEVEFESTIGSISVEASGDGTVWAGNDCDHPESSKAVKKVDYTVQDTTNPYIRLHSLANPGSVFTGWEISGRKDIPNTDLSCINFPKNKGGDYVATAHFKKIVTSLYFEDDKTYDESYKNDNLVMKFFGNIIKRDFEGESDGDGQSFGRDTRPMDFDFEIYTSDGQFVEGLNLPGPSFTADGPMGTVLVEKNTITLNPIKSFEAGKSYYVLVKEYRIMIETADGDGSVGDQDTKKEFAAFPFEGFTKPDDWNFTIASTPAPVQDSVPAFSSEKADPPVVAKAIVPEPIPQALPVIISAPAPVIIAAPPAPVVEMVEAIPLGVPLLPKTGELPASLFYGLGGVLVAAGAFIKRK